MPTAPPSPGRTFRRHLRRILLAVAMSSPGFTAMGESALQPVVLPSRQMPNLLVVGRQGCGKTSTLAAFGQSIAARLSPHQAQITIIDPKTSLIGKIQGEHVRAYAYTPDDIDRVLAAHERGCVPAICQVANWSHGRFSLKALMTQSR